jgi:CPA2 family monovalent cation:H+ antiporter-2
MPDNINLILMLTGGIAAALVLGLFTHKLKLSPIVGYLLAGILIGPHTPGFVADENIALQCAEIGVILLMFGVGLHFHLKDLWAVKDVAVIGAIVQIATATFLSALLLNLFGWSWTEGLLIGVAVSVASTVVLLRVLTDNNAVQTPSGHVAIGWLIVEDIFIILVLIMIPIIFGANIGSGLGTAPKLAFALAKIVFFVAFMLIAGKRLIPWILRYAARTGSRELFTLTVLTVALGIAVGSAKLFGASMALGAFLAGMIVGQSDFSARAATDALPMRDAFAVLFFVSIGMLFDPLSVFELWQVMLVITGVIVIGKPLAAAIVVLALGRPLPQALSVAVALAQIGELSFVLAAVGISMEILRPETMGILVFGSIVSIVINPLLYRQVRPLASWLNNKGLFKGKPSIANQEHFSGVQEAADKDEHRVIVVGYGPVGSTVARILTEVNIAVTIIEMNIDTVQQLQDKNFKVVHGDASNREILNYAGIESAKGLVISVMSIPSQDIVKAAQELNPSLDISVATTYLNDAYALQASGVAHVFSAEGEIALAMADQIMKNLGATSEQIERENFRIREQYFLQKIT